MYSRFVIGLQHKVVHNKIIVQGIKDSNAITTLAIDLDLLENDKTSEGETKSMTSSSSMHSKEPEFKENNSYPKAIQVMEPEKLENYLV